MRLVAFVARRVFFVDECYLVLVILLKINAVVVGSSAYVAALPTAIVIAVKSNEGSLVSQQSV